MKTFLMFFFAGCLGINAVASDNLNSTYAHAEPKSTQCEFSDMNLSAVNNKDILNNITILETCVKNLQEELTHSLIIRSGGLNYEERMNEVKSYRARTPWS